jgi:hypothetical protein
MRLTLALLGFRFTRRELGGRGGFLRTSLGFFLRRLLGRNAPGFRVLCGLDGGKPLGLFLCGTAGRISTSYFGSEALGFFPRRGLGGHPPRLRRAGSLFRSYSSRLRLTGGLLGG